MGPHLSREAGVPKEEIRYKAVVCAAAELVSEQTPG